MHSWLIYVPELLLAISLFQDFIEFSKRICNVNNVQMSYFQLSAYEMYEILLDENKSTVFYND